MEYKNKQKEQGDCEHITLECTLKEYFKIQPVLAHIKLGKINRSHPDQIEYGKKQVVLWQVNGVGSEYGYTGKQQNRIKRNDIP